MMDQQKDAGSGDVELYEGREIIRQDTSSTVSDLDYIGYFSIQASVN